MYIDKNILHKVYIYSSPKLTNMISKILNSVKDFEECIIDGTLKVCFLHENSKISKKGWSGFVKTEELYLMDNAENNLGISLVGSEYPGAHILTCIDIDGDKREIDNVNVEKFSKDWVYKIISLKLNELGIPFMAIKSSSGGYHIYVYTLSESMRYSSTQGLYYPSNPKKAYINDDVEMFLNGHLRHFSVLQEDVLPKTIVEIWCQKRYMVAPGSDIFDEDGNFVGTVELLEDGVQEFKKIGLVEDSLNDIVREAFLDAGFEENSDLKYTPNQNYSFENKSLSNKLTPFGIQVIGDLLIKYFPKISGQKHQCTLALGGYLFNKNISYESACELGQYVLDNVSDDLFKSKSEFIKTLTHDIQLNDPTRKQTGLATIEEILQPFCDKEKVGKKLHLATNPIFHKFWPDGRYAKKYNEIVINYAQHYMVKNVVQTKVNNDNEIVATPIQNYKINHSIDKIQIINDISNIEKTAIWERPVKVFFSTSDRQTYVSKAYRNTNELFKEYRKLPGAYTDSAKSIIESVFREFESIDFLDEIEYSTRPGIWLSAEQNQLRKFITNDNELVEVFPNAPERKYLRSALSLLKQINDIYPWADGKFGYFVKMGLTLPYADVLKNNFDRPHPSIILHGEAGTLKTTASEMLLHFNITENVDDETNIVGGGELLSEYRFGRIMDISSYPLVVNEAEYLFSVAKTRNLIKDAAHGKLIRKPGGNDPRSYYSHRSGIYTMNTLPAAAEDPAYLRRFVNIEFDRNERGDTPEMIQKMSFLNYGGVNNARFKELSHIGDYVFYILNRNLDWFTLPLDVIQNKIIESMEEYVGDDLSFLKQDESDFAYTDRTEQENSTLTMVLRVLREPYLRHKGRYLQNSSDIEMVRNMITSLSDYYYIHEAPNDFVLVDIGLKNKFNEEYFKEGKSITLKGCCNCLNDLDLDLNELELTSTRVYGRKKTIRGIKMTLEDLTKILTNKKEVI